MATHLKIGELADLAGINSSKIRFYEKEKVFNLGQRLANGYRVYPPEAVDLLMLIGLAQEVGFTLAELKALLPDTNKPGEVWSHDALEQAIETKLESIRHMQKRLANHEQVLTGVLHQLRHHPHVDNCAENARLVLGMRELLEH